MSAEDIQEQIQAVYDAGMCGFTLWSANNIYGKSYAAMADMHVPDTCRADMVVTQ